uniref:Uncharacterized protein n=1 Tax=Panagrolaimus superbus TaxID=310955 RepID=A0A914Z298_9BILA
MKLLILLTVFYAVAAQQPKDVEFDISEKVIEQMPLNTVYIPCTDEKYMYCQSQFNAFIGYQGQWTDVNQFIHTINSFYKADVSTGFLSLCHARTLLFQCLGTEYESCTSRFQFLRKGANATIAYQLSGVFNSLDFECSGGSVQATTNWGCIWTVWNSQSYQSAKQNCLSVFYNNTFTSQSQVCVAGQGLSVCLSLQFSAAQAPCNVNDLIWFECERIVNLFQFDGLCSNIRCQVKNTFLADQPKTIEEAFQRRLTHNEGLAEIHLQRKHRSPKVIF